ncbi:MAG: vitamin B12-dependent ribonucleotide reductase, partial [Acidobacteria bacterium]|nr:vitamin B12-dependent ribonucleotide reductase [Acidobacteriota bacterium]
VGMYEDGQPGEIFIVMAKEGSTVSGLMDSFATAISLALQYGVPLKVLVDKFSHTRFEPSGWTGNQDIPFAKSVMDYIFRWLGQQFIPGYKAKEGVIPGEAPEAEPWSTGSPTPSPASAREKTTAPSLATADAPTCSDCGSIMTRNGSCYKCENCGSTSGCS